MGKNCSSKLQQFSIFICQISNRTVSSSSVKPKFSIFERKLKFTWLGGYVHAKLLTLFGLGPSGDVIPTI